MEIYIYAFVVMATVLTLILIILSQRHEIKYLNSINKLKNEECKMLAEHNQHMEEHIKKLNDGFYEYQEASNGLIESLEKRVSAQEEPLKLSKELLLTYGVKVPY
jgi:predicted Holliday junction resolvase-like endonuclease